MSKWSGKTRGGVAGYKIFVFFIKYLGVKAAYLLLRFVALYFLFFSDKTGIKYYFNVIHGYRPIKTFISIYKNYYLLGQVLIDKVAFLSGNAKGFTFDYEGEEYLHEMSRNQHGGMIIGAHMGNWEVAGQLLKRIETPVNIVMLEAEHEKIKDLMDDVLVNKDMKIIPIKDDMSHLTAITEALKNNEIVALHGDRFLPGATTCTVNFMGKEAELPTGPLYIASKCHVPVSFVYTLKDTSTHYHFYATPGKIFPYPSKLKTRKEDMKTMVKEYAENLEKMVLKYPLQWFNYYPFWKTEK